MINNHVKFSLFTIFCCGWGPGCNCCCLCNRTPLHAAAFTDHVECLQLLLGHNAQVNCVDAGGKTPLMMAAENGQTNAVGRSLTLKSHGFCLQLTEFVFGFDVCLCLAEVLVSSAKADLTLQDANKNTALHLACSKVRSSLFCYVFISVGVVLHSALSSSNGTLHLV